MKQEEACSVEIKNSMDPAEKVSSKQSEENSVDPAYELLIDQMHLPTHSSAEKLKNAFQYGSGATGGVGNPRILGVKIWPKVINFARVSFFLPYFISVYHVSFKATCWALQLPRPRALWEYAVYEPCKIFLNVRGANFFAFLTDKFACFAVFAGFLRKTFHQI